MDGKELAGIPLFEGLSSRDRDKVAHWMDVVDVPAGYHLLEEGRFPHEFFVILDGSVEVSHGDQLLASLGPGDFLGEIAMVQDVTRTATVVTSSPTRLAVMARREFSSMYDGVPSIRAAIDAAISRRK
jgi:CRP-like cAMP-binding protein